MLPDELSISILLFVDLPEILVEGDRYRVIRKREQYDDLVRGELL